LGRVIVIGGRERRCWRADNEVGSRDGATDCRSVRYSDVLGQLRDSHEFVVHIALREKKNRERKGREESVGLT
jgi:hypothetical protein